MNRSQIVFVIIVNALFILLVGSIAYLLYELRRPDAEVPIILEVVTPSSPPSQLSATPTPAESIDQPAALPEGGESPEAEVFVPHSYIIREGDTLGGIAELFGVAQSSLAALNGITDPNLIVPGQTLIMPNASGVAGSGPDRAPDSSDIAIQILNPGRYAEEAIIIINMRHPQIDFSGWSVVSSQEGAYRFAQIPPLLRGESIRLYSRIGTDNAYDKYWGRVPNVWGPGTSISLHDPDGTEVINLAVS